MSIAARILCLLSLAFKLGAAGMPEIMPRVSFPGEDIGKGVWLSAPHILVVTVKSATIDTKEVFVSSLVVMRLVQVEAEVENELSGSLGTRTVKFYFFGYAGGRGNPGYQRQTYWLDPGNRYIVFLREEEGVLRTIFDMDELSFHVLSGRHNSAEFPSSMSIEEKIARVCLSPGSQYSPKELASAPHLVVNGLWGIAPAATTVGLLRALTSHPNREVRESACVELSQSFQFTDSCLPRFVKDLDLKLRGDAARIVAGKDKEHEMAFSKMFRTDPLPLLVAQKDQERPALIQTLRTGPLELSYTGEIKGFAEELELFTTDYYPEVRREACAALKRVFPARRLPAACGRSVPAGGGPKPGN